MRYGTDTTTFDITDIAPMTRAIDHVDDALSVAHSVLEDYAPEGGMSAGRIERLARFVVGRMYVDGAVIVHAGAISTYVAGGISVARVGKRTSIRAGGALLVMEPDQAGVASALLLRAHEDAEDES